MDLFDLGTYFSSHVPVKALSNPLLRFSACALAAKQLGRVNGVKAIIGGVVSMQARMENWHGAGNVDWYYHAAKYYDKAIQLLMEVLKGDINDSDLGLLVVDQGRPHPELMSGGKRDLGRLSNAESDEVLAATAILSVYELLEASGPAWDRHLSGAKSLLDIAHVKMLSLENPVPRPPSHSPTFSKARRAIFWNFARQDHLSACQ